MFAGCTVLRHAEGWVPHTVHSLQCNVDALTPACPVHNLTGKAKILDTVREVVGLHKDRYVFPAKLIVTKVSGANMEPMYLGVVRVITSGWPVLYCSLLHCGSLRCISCVG
jgi:hypothetical protein